MSRGRKKDAILRLCREMALEEIGEAEFARLKARLHQELGGADRPSDGYILDVLREAGCRLRLSGPFVPPTFEDEYARQFEGVLKFDTFEHAEQSLRELGRLYHRFKESGDGKGIAYARALAHVGRRRARAAARRAKEERARAIKEEIAEWFALWASSPETFEVWVELRKRAPDFQRRFGLGQAEPSSDLARHEARESSVVPSAISALPDAVEKLGSALPKCEEDV